MDTLKFSSNFNNKLDCNCFTTIRLNGKKFKKGNKLSVELKTNTSFVEVKQVEIVKIHILKIFQLTDLVCYLDTGYNKSETIKMIVQMYSSQKIDWNTQDLVLVVMRTLKDSKK